MLLWGIHGYDANDEPCAYACLLSSLLPACPHCVFFTKEVTMNVNSDPQSQTVKHMRIHLTLTTKKAKGTQPHQVHDHRNHDRCRFNLAGCDRAIGR